MQDAFLMRGRHALGDLDAEFDRLANRQRGGVQARTQALAIEQLRDDVGRPVVMTDVVDREDVRVVERGGRSASSSKRRSRSG